MINYNDKIDHSTISDRDRSGWFETILQIYFKILSPLFIFMNEELNISLALFSQNVFKRVAEPVVPLSQSPIFRFRAVVPNIFLLAYPQTEKRKLGYT